MCETGALACVTTMLNLVLDYQTMAKINKNAIVKKEDSRRVAYSYRLLCGTKFACNFKACGNNKITTSTHHVY